MCQQQNKFAQVLNKISAFEELWSSVKAGGKGEAKNCLKSMFRRLALKSNTNVGGQWLPCGDPRDRTCFKKNTVDRPAVSMSRPLCSPRRQVFFQLCVFSSFLHLATIYSQGVRSCWGMNCGFQSCWYLDCWSARCCRFKLPYSVYCTF